jgi:hypothetical protein
MDNVFIIRHILEKRYEYNLTLHQSFIELTQAYDSVKCKAAPDAVKNMEFPKHYKI